jgi:hypothetical protein
MLELLLIPLFRLKQVHHILQLIYILLLACVCMYVTGFICFYSDRPDIMPCTILTIQKQARHL